MLCITKPGLHSDLEVIASCVDSLKATCGEDAQHEMATIFIASYITISTVMIKSRNKCYLHSTWGTQGTRSICSLVFFFFFFFLERVLSQEHKAANGCILF